MPEYKENDYEMSLDEKLERRKNAIYDQWLAITNSDYASTTVNEDGKFLNEPYLTPGDISRKLGWERNKLRKMITETFRDCLIDIVERDIDDPEGSLGKQNRAKTLLSSRDLEIMKIIVSYKERGVSDIEIKNDIERRKKGTIPGKKISDPPQQLPSDSAFQSMIREILLQAVQKTNETNSVQIQKYLEPMQQTLSNVLAQQETTIRESIEKGIENDRLKDALDKKEAENSELKDALTMKEAEIENLRKETEERLAKLEADLEDARNKKRPWFKPWW